MDYNKLANQLIIHEGNRKFPYTDTTGNLTIGVGHNLTAKGLSPSQIRNILSDDINDTVSFLGKNLPWWAGMNDDVRQRALADMAFNLMGKILDFKTMLPAIQAKNWDAAADALLASKFAQQTGIRAIHLASMIRTGKDF